MEGRDGSWFVLEDNLRIPSGASYPLIARRLCRRCSPESFRQHNIVDNRNYGALLRGVMDNVNTGGINVIFTPGRYNAAYFEHSYLAELSGAVLAESGDLFVEDNKVITAVKRARSASVRFTAASVMNILTRQPFCPKASSAYPA